MLLLQERQLPTGLGEFQDVCGKSCWEFHLRISLEDAVTDLLAPLGEHVGVDIQSISDVLHLDVLLLTETHGF